MGTIKVIITDDNGAVFKFQQSVNTRPAPVLNEQSITTGRLAATGVRLSPESDDPKEQQRQVKARQEAFKVRCAARRYRSREIKRGLKVLSHAINMFFITQEVWDNKHDAKRSSVPDVNRVKP